MNPITLTPVEFESAVVEAIPGTVLDARKHQEGLINDYTNLYIQCKEAEERLAARRNELADVEKMRVQLAAEFEAVRRTMEQAIADRESTLIENAILKAQLDDADRRLLHDAETKDAYYRNEISRTLVAVRGALDIEDKRFTERSLGRAEAGQQALHVIAGSQVSGQLAQRLGEFVYGQVQSTRDHGSQCLSSLYRLIDDRLDWLTTDRAYATGDSEYVPF